MDRSHESRYVSAADCGIWHLSVAADWDTGDTMNGWKCLRYTQSIPHYYQYHYTKDGSPAGPGNPKKCSKNCYEAGARGDLDGNGTTSTFAVTAQIDTKSGKLTKASDIFIDNEFE